MRAIALAVMLPMVGTVYAKEPVLLGQGKYMLTDQNFTIFGSTGKIVAKLSKQAHEFCQSKHGKEAFLLDSDGSEAVPGTINNSGRLQRAAQGATGTIYFQCGAPEPVAATEPKTDIYTELPKLKALLDSGAITQEEYDAQKKKLLGN
jgi:Short C-terminal domain